MLGAQHHEKRYLNFYNYHVQDIALHNIVIIEPMSL